MGKEGAEERAVLGGGCFWCTEAIFREVPGVRGVLPGYAGGSTADPTYEEVCTGTTGHAEVVQITFDPAVVSYAEVLRIFFATHDPTTRDRQGHDVGSQYRSIILYLTEEQRRTAEAIRAALEASKAYRRPIVTEIAPLTAFYPAEEYHREYFARHASAPYCQFVIAPKLARFRAAHWGAEPRAP